jgi:hypothetical protein
MGLVTWEKISDWGLKQMACERSTCETHLRRLMQLPYARLTEAVVFSSWVTVMATEAEDSQHVARAVTHLLETRILPTCPEEISDAIEATRQHAKPAEHYAGGCCGRLIPDWQFYDYDPDIEFEITASDKRNTTKCWQPSQCVNGWIRRTVVVAKPGMVTEDGDPFTQRYEFTAKCKCQPGGTV